jgi:glycosyltransferase involved in cell wall biosynthesis
MKKRPLVSVKTITYNHEPFIAQCIESVMMQKTNFDFEFIIGEDCSTDGTMAIVQKYAKKYPDIIRIITSEHNVGAAENDHRSDLACIGKYVAFCEGDDYWLDPYKLQKQVDFLEANPDFGMVHTNFTCLNGQKRLDGVWNDVDIPRGEVLNELLTKNCVATASVCIRNDLLKKINIGETILSNNWRMGDYPLWLEVAGQSKIGYLEDDTTCYRIHSSSATHSTNWEGDYKFFQDRFKIKRYYAKKYNRLSLMPMLEKRYHQELLKFAIFLKDNQLRTACINYFKTQGTRKEIPYLLFSKYPLLDSIFELIYSSRKKMQTLV